MCLLYVKFCHTFYVKIFYVLLGLICKISTCMLQIFLSKLNKTGLTYIILTHD